MRHADIHACMNNMFYYHGPCPTNVAYINLCHISCQIMCVGVVQESVLKRIADISKKISNIGSIVNYRS